MLTSLPITLFIMNLYDDFHEHYGNVYIVLNSFLNLTICNQYPFLFPIMKSTELLFINCHEMMLNKQKITKLWSKTKRLVTAQYSRNDSK